MINYENLSSPVLLITYRRPENTEKIINILLENNIKNIFIYNNGPIGIIYQKQLIGFLNHLIR